MTISEAAANMNKLPNAVTRRRILFFLLLVLSIITSSLAAYQGWIDSGFPYMNIADSELVAREGRIIINPFTQGASSLQNNVANVRSSRIEVVLVPVFISKVLGIPVSALTFLPLTGILLPIVGYVLVKQLLSSDIWGFVFGMYLALEPQGLLRNYNTNIQGYGQLFFLLTVFLASKYCLEKPDRKYFFLTFVTFVMTVLSYYSSEFYSLVFAISMAILLYLKRADASQRRFFTNASILFLTVTVMFEPIVGYYSQKLSEEGSRDIFSVLGRFVNDALGVIGIRTAQENTASVISTPSYLLFVNVTLLFVVFLPLLVLAPNILKGKKYHEVLVASMILAGVLDLAAYSGLEGHVDLKFFYLFFPMCSIVALVHRGNMRKNGGLYRKSKALFAVGILLLVSLRFALYASGPYLGFSTLHPQQLSDFDRIVNMNSSSQVYLTDNVAAGKLLSSLAKVGLYESSLVYQYPSVKGISFLYSGNASDIVYLARSLDRLPTYVIVSKYSVTRPNFPAQGWSSFPPFLNYTQVLNATNLAVSYMGLDAILLTMNYARP